MNARELGRALQPFAVLEPTHLPVHFVQVYLVVLADGPCTFRHIEEELALSNSAVSRTVMALGAVTRKGVAGLGLLEVFRDPAEGRRFLVRLSSRGRALSRQLRNV